MTSTLTSPVKEENTRTVETDVTFCLLTARNKLKSGILRDNNKAYVFHVGTQVQILLTQARKNTESKAFKACKRLGAFLANDITRHLNEK